MVLRILTVTLLSLACTALADDAKIYPSWLRNCEQDTPSPVEGTLEGSIPQWVEGRLIRVGPGIHHIGDMSYNHMFDPLAVLHLVQIHDGKATYTSRFLESEVYKTNMREQRITMAEFGTPAMPDPCESLFGKFFSWFQYPDMGDNCLVNVLQATDQLIAMTETHVVRVVDPSNLKVVGEGVKIPDYVNVQRATAHPHVDEHGTIYNLAMSKTDKGPGYTIISHKNGHIPEASAEATIAARWKFHPAYMHSFAITENYFIVIESPLAIDVATMLAAKYLGLTTEAAIKWYPNEKSRFRVMRRSDGQEVNVKFISDDFFTFHHINAYEMDNQLVVDVCAISSGEVIKALYLDNVRKQDSDPTKKKFDSIATRFVIPLNNVDSHPLNEEILVKTNIEIIPEDSSLPTRSPSAVRTGEKEVYLQGAVISDNFFEMPRINYAQNGKPYRYAYGVRTTKDKSIDFSIIVKLDVRTGRDQTWSDPDYFVSEPVFLPEPGKDEEDAGAILTILLHKTDVKHAVFLLLNARDLSEMARVHFQVDGTVTPTFHGQFISSFDDIHGY